MKVEVKPVGEAATFQPFVLSIQADNPGEQDVLKKFGILNVTIPEHLVGRGDLTTEQGRTFTSVQTGVSAAISSFENDQKVLLAANKGKTSARRKKA